MHRFIWRFHPVVPIQDLASHHRGMLHYWKLGMGKGMMCKQLQDSKSAPHVALKHLVPRNTSFRSIMGLDGIKV